MSGGRSARSAFAVAIASSIETRRPSASSRITPPVNRAKADGSAIARKPSSKLPPQRKLAVRSKLGIDPRLQFVDGLTPLEYVKLDTALLAEEPHRHEPALTLERSLRVDERYGVAKCLDGLFKATLPGSSPTEKDVDLIRHKRPPASWNIHERKHPLVKVAAFLKKGWRLERRMGQGASRLAHPTMRDVIVAPVQPMTTTRVPTGTFV